MNAEKMNYLEDEFDLVYINSVLMHTNHLLVLRECSRVLKAGGKLIVIEPLQHTLFLQGYRLFSHYRLTKPQYMTFRKFKDGASFFTSYNHTEFYFFACLFLPVFYLRIKWLYAFFFLAAKVDKILLLLFPFLKFGAWVSVAEFRK
jgi:SAM-dependent methyltransferase